MTVSRLQPFGETIFATMSRRAAETGAINLGQGFPDWDGPQEVLLEAQRQIHNGNNQYAPGRGMKVLRDAVVADRQHRLAQRYDPDTECLITVGATEAISATVLGLVEPGAQVVVIEPYYDAYIAAIALADAHYSAVPLIPRNNEFRLDVDALNRAVSDETAMIIINSPHNPTGSVLSDDELAAIASAAITHDCIVLADEVYERLHFENKTHASIASLPGMRERTVVVSSAAKTFNVTGWKTGWALAPAELLDGILKAKQFLTFVGATPLQSAVAVGLTDCAEWVENLRKELQTNRDILSQGLTELGAKVYDSAAGYFVVADISPWFGMAAKGNFDSVAACMALTEAGVAAIPVSAFTAPADSEVYSGLIRFAFCKKRETLEEALVRLRTFVS